VFIFFCRVGRWEQEGGVRRTLPSSNGRTTRDWLIIADNAGDWQVSLNLGGSSSRAAAVKRKGWEIFII
jgi:hypothetical protein